MWQGNTYVVNGEIVGRIWPRKGENFWKWGYTGGFITTDKKDAKKQVERQVKK